MTSCGSLHASRDGLPLDPNLQTPKLIEGTEG
jgi:hypothetical protein